MQDLLRRKAEIEREIAELKEKESLTVARNADAIRKWDQKHVWVVGAGAVSGNDRTNSRACVAVYMSEVHALADGNPPAQIVKLAVGGARAWVQCDSDEKEFYEGVH